MATFQALTWNGIPAGVRATDGGRTARTKLSLRFQATIDDVATRVGRSVGDAYLADWTWIEPAERSGEAEAGAAQIAAGLEETYPPTRLAELRCELISSLCGQAAGAE